MTGNMTAKPGTRGRAGVRVGHASATMFLWLGFCAVPGAGCTDIGVAVPRCGDGKLDTSAGEQCDDGGDSATCDRDCTPAVCGDGLFNPAAGEQCDDGGDSATCNADCTLSRCGDGYVNAAAGEACDGVSTTCDHDCTPAVCGDGVVNVLAGEVCDDGNADDTDACVAGCQPAVCGDGLVHAGVEECDDGNVDESDACMTWCEVASCTDGLRNGDESDLDCGVGCGRGCRSGQRCSTAGDCFSGVCSGGVCTTRLAAGAYHSCILLEGGDVRCWGHNGYGRLGYGHEYRIGDDEVPSSVDPVDVGGRVVQIVAGGSHTCALLEGGDVRCWGANGYGQLGYGHTSAIGDNEVPGSVDPVDVGGRAVQLAAGDSHTCALLADGDVRCWGYNWSGQLGYGHTGRIGDNESPSSVDAVDVGGRAVHLAAGDSHTCALLESGGVRCWGYNAEGQLGYGHTDYIGDNESPSSAGDVITGGRVVQIVAGAEHTCALRSDGAVRCWGDGDDGKLGNGSDEDIGDDELPGSQGDVDVGGRAVQLTAGHWHTCALLDDGAIRCWGENGDGQLGQGHRHIIGDDELPGSADVVDVGGRAVEIAAGGRHTCALLEGGALRCWGRNWHGQLGYGNTRMIGDTEAPASVDPVSYR